MQRYGDLLPEFQIPDWSEVIAPSSVDYNLEETENALPLKWEEISLGMPKAEHAASLDALEHADPSVEKWLLDPSLTFLPESE